jgi:leucyl-tRNA synthetase
MSKSKGNVVGAMEMAEKFGADTGRLYTLFAAPPEKDMEWSDQSAAGCSRFLNRVYRLVEKHAAGLRGVKAESGELIAVSEKETILLRKAHQSLKRVRHDYESRWHFNSAISQVMELVNEVHAQEPLSDGVRPVVIKDVLELMTLMLAPMAPHLCEEMWQMLGHADGLASAGWPAYRAELAAETQIEVVVQVNGKLRGKILVDAGADEETTGSLAASEPRVAEFLAGKTIVKRVVVPGKLVNFVVR